MSHTQLYLSIHTDIRYRAGNQINLVSDPVDDSRVLYVPLPVAKAAPALLAACHSAASCLIACQAGVGPAPDIAATLATLRAAIAATKGTR